MLIDPLGGIQDVQIPYRPLLGVGEGSLVKLAQGLYAEVIGAKLERRHGAWTHFLRVQPVPTGWTLTGWGEHVDAVIDLSDEVSV